MELHKFQGYLDEAEGRVSTLNPPSTRTSSIGINGSNGGLGLKKLIGSKGSNNILPQHGGSDESLSRSASDSSVSNPNAKPSLPGTPQQTHGYLLRPYFFSFIYFNVYSPCQLNKICFCRSSHSPESGVGSHASHTSLPDSEVERLYANAEAEIDAEEDGTLNGSEAYENELLPVLGTCRALYAFEGLSTHSFVFLIEQMSKSFNLILLLLAQSEGSMPLHENEELYVIEIDQGDGWTRVRRNSGFEEGFVPTSYIQSTLYNTC